LVCALVIKVTSTAAALLYAGFANGAISAMFLARRGMELIGKVDHVCVGINRDGLMWELKQHSYENGEGA